MRQIFTKRAIAIITSILLIYLLSVSATAATGYSWGPHDFTPYSGSFIALNNYVSALNMRWSASQVTIWGLAQSAATMSDLTTEYEFRPIGYNPHQIWSSGSISFASNMPSAYYEFQPYDEDDIAVCSGWAAGYNDSTYYYGSMYLTAASGASSTAQYIFESEYGMKFPIVSDSLPSAYEQYTLQTTYMGTNYNWY
jgi:hypothetical protein